ncbi:MAG TPA: ferritin-like domain-containing protein [Planctomycetota bacterium]|nr:ferritin-like domain-containing protein [Planctomycetota bacterium]
MGPKTRTDAAIESRGNRTGMATSPVDGAQMLEAANEIPLDAEAALDFDDARRDFAAAAPEPVGSMPPPATLKGAGKKLLQALQGNQANVLLDKMGERLAFERTGARLYEALMAKVDTWEGSGGPTHTDLDDFRSEELTHFDLLRRHLERLGADPTVQTPCADLAGVAALGVMQVVTDPRTTLAQGLGAILTAELTDTAGWELLARLAREVGETDMASEFEAALAAEEEHVAKVKDWLQAMVLAQAGA